jgi:hypothetical protein
MLPCGYPCGPGSSESEAGERSPPGWARNLVKVARQVCEFFSPVEQARLPLSRCRQAEFCHLSPDIARIRPTIPSRSSPPAAGRPGTSRLPGRQMPVTAGFPRGPAGSSRAARTWSQATGRHAGHQVAQPPGNYPDVVPVHKIITVEYRSGSCGYGVIAKDEGRATMTPGCPVWVPRSGDLAAGRGWQRSPCGILAA